MNEQRIAWGANNTGQAAIPQVRKMTVKEMKFKFCSPAFIPLTNRPPIAPGHIAHSARGKSQPQQSSRSRLFLLLLGMMHRLGIVPQRLLGEPLRVLVLSIRREMIVASAMG
jgi:hypothetical protein